ncbi:hypothetical protein [Thermoactinospora rubra]|uniref:hypothetical protein n=1 Tax=Thermoactinospora rubra TaxID=1088767 RepID=UPI00117F2FEE|nr:hypothetical protein [Thermoactinospora rubra]
MRGLSTERAEEEQIQRLGRVQERLAASGIRALLVRRLRLTLFPNRYDPPEHGGPVLLAGQVQVTAAPGFHVEADDGSSADFREAEETAAYVSSLITSASPGGSTASGSSSGANHP